MKIIKKFIHTLLSISGLIPENTTLLRAFFWLSSVAWAIFLLPKFARLDYAVLYFAISTLFYIGLIFLVLPQQGLRLKWIAAVGEEQAYLQYEGILAFAFFHNGVSLGFISESSKHSAFWGDFPPLIVMSLVVILFLTGFVVKLWSAWLVGIPIYYWKDMFLDKKISDFVEAGPYKFLNNPMYGVGQVQVYAIAIYYNSIYGLAFGALNQLLVFFFYFKVEKPFINRMYLNKL
ncbi:MAG: phosphatidylethanolamine N-methyltransferase family protein [Cyclobacteriaceae bacterium]|nr:phosphatidylethanolamine N-methyltransferase family protein [Cyclobacteriaceae bacterium]